MSVIEEQAGIDRRTRQGANSGQPTVAWLLYIFLSIVIVVAIGVFLYVAYAKAGSLVPPETSRVIASKDPSFLGGVVDSVFGTIQFSIAVLSGVVIVFTGIISFVVGRSARQSQEASRQELAEVAELYRENLRNVSETLIANARDSVDKYMNTPSVETMLKRYADLLTELENSYTSVKPVVDDFLSFRKAFEELEADYAGGFLRLSREQDEYIASNDKRPLWSSPEERAILQQSLLRVQEGALRRAVSANTCFNAAQTASTFEFDELAHRCAVLANWLEAKPLYEARVRRSEFERGDRYVVTLDADEAFSIVSTNPTNDPAIAEQIRSEAFDQLVKPLPNVPLDASHNFYSEVWNTFIHKQDLTAFVVLYEHTKTIMETRGRYVPSYFHAQLAKAHAITSKPGWQDATQRELGAAIGKLNEESPMAAWYKPTQREIGTLLGMIGVGEPPPDISHPESA